MTTETSAAVIPPAFTVARAGWPTHRAKARKQRSRKYQARRNRKANS